MNNPDKTAGRQRTGAPVVGHIPLRTAPTPFNARYLATKGEKSVRLLP